jgi:hypothetical protein
LQQERQSLADVAAWWRAHPSDNVGIITGAISDIVIVDCDDDDAIMWVLEHLPATPWIVQTGRGRQYGYRHPGYRVANRAHVGGMALDVRGDGGYVSAPPSVHKSGAVYAWVGRPWECDPPPVYDPAWLPAPPTAPTPTPPPSGVSDAARLRGAEAWFRSRDPAIAGQGGHLQTVKTAYRAATLGVSFADTLDLMRAWNATCQPPWTEAELQTFVRSAWAKAGQ